MQIIADSGGTKTDWRFIYQNGHIEQLTSSGLNPNYISNSEMKQMLKEELHLDSKEPLEAVHFYGAGCSNIHNGQRIKDALSDRLSLDPSLIEVNHDLLAAARASASDQPGIVCILGTGSNACSYDGFEIVEEMVNLGYVLGDEGSGAYVGKNIIKAYLENDMPEEVRMSFNKVFPEINQQTVVDALYNQERPNRFLASFFNFVFDNQKHSYCLQLMIDSFESFLEKSVLTFKRHQELPIHFIGGVAYNANNIIRKVLERHNLKAGLVMQSPIVGLTLYHQKHY